MQSMSSLGNLFLSIAFLLLPIISSGQQADTVLKSELVGREYVEYLSDEAFRSYQNGEFENSLNLTKTAISVSEQEGLLDVIGTLLFNAGMTYRMVGDDQMALKYFFMSIEHSETFHSDLYHASALNQIGVIYRLQGNYSGSLEHFFNALTTFQKVEDRKGTATVLNNIGIVYLFQKNYEKALEYYLASLEIEEEQGDEYGISISYINIGEVLKYLERYDEALDYLFKSLVLAEKHEDKDIDGDSVGILYNEIGSIYFLQRNYELSNSYLHKALDIFLDLDNKLRLAECRLYLADLYLNTNRAVQAKMALFKALSDGELIESPEIISEANKKLSQIFENEKNFRRAFEHYKTHIETRDSIFNEDQMKSIVQAEMLYEFDKEMQQAKFEQAKREIQMKENASRQKLLRNFFIIAFITLLVVVFFVLNAYGNKKKINEQLNRQHEQILNQNQHLLNNREEILAQRDEIEEKNLTLEESQRIIEAKNERMVSSIEYAQTIQQAILPKQQELAKNFPHHFVFFQPKDIVSGDFYWYSFIDNLFLLAVVDCTGHGVPGAFMSLIGNTVLNQVVNEGRVSNPAKILEAANIQIRHLLGQDEGNRVHASMDICLLAIERNKRKAIFAGAGRPLYVVRNGKVELYKGDLFGVGGFQRENIRTFENKHIDLVEKTTLYLTTDGYTDQMNSSSEKYGRKRFMELITEIDQLDSKEKHAVVQNGFINHKGNQEQIDDICVLGICLD